MIRVSLTSVLHIFIGDALSMPILRGCFCDLNEAAIQCFPVAFSSERTKPRPSHLLIRKSCQMRMLPLSDFRIQPPSQGAAFQCYLPLREKKMLLFGK